MVRDSGAAATDDQYFRDQRVQFWRAAMDHFEESDGNEMAFRADAAYNFEEDSFLRRIKVGARYADRLDRDGRTRDLERAESCG